VTWKDYQEQAATFFRGLGLAATTDERITGVRGIHDVDVAVRSETAGIKQLWIVECKKWKTRVKKLHVAALAEIIHDIGADRGILLSESGFQAGAIRMAQSSNITLSSISDLEENSEAERVQLKLRELRRRLSVVHDRIDALMIHKVSHEGGAFSASARAVPGADMQKLMTLRGFTGMIEFSLSAAEVGRQPLICYEWDLENVKPVIAKNDSEIVSRVDNILVHLENELAKQEVSVRTSKIEHLQT
jgi:restriction system protein